MVSLFASRKDWKTHYFIEKKGSMKSSLVFLLLWPFCGLLAQVDYDQLTNWYFHPDKLINLLADYNLDVAVIDKDLSIQSTLAIENQSTTNTGIDVFWVHPTQLLDPPASPGVVDLSDQPASVISATIIAQGSLLAKYGRFYAPRYRQATPASFLNNTYSDSERADALLEAYGDIKAAFLHYLNNHNDGNKIILAGHSQGSFLLAMLLRDVFDQDPDLRSKLVLAALGGMPYVHAQMGTYLGGQWENIPLCTQINECGCVHTWRSFKETQTIPALVTTLPVFNEVLVTNGVVHRTVDLETDWFVADSLYYGAESDFLRYYIAPDAGYDLGGDANFIAFDSLFTARMKRTSATKVVLAIDYTEDPTDQRPNDLLPLENSIEFLGSGFHTKDYHIYLWALIEQIDTKLAGCLPPTNVRHPKKANNPLQVFPNPNHGTFTVVTNVIPGTPEKFIISDLFGRVVLTGELDGSTEIILSQPGIYFIHTAHGSARLMVE
jgi:pimeloyl-ACP methyl ester carboxylesterase